MGVRKSGSVILINDKGAKAPKSNADRQAALKLNRVSQGIFKRTFWVTNEQYAQLKQLHEKLTKRDHQI